MLIFRTIINIIVVSFISFCNQAGFGRAFNYEDPRPNIYGFQFIVVVVALGFSYFFALFGDQALMESRG